MKPTLGWTLLSRDSLRRAEARLNDEFQGVRDEIGFLTLHQAYADRFFPGTSVLQTRLRYALFVPWIYDKIASHHISGRVEELILQEEIHLTGRLKKSKEEGIIGDRTYPRPTVQPPSMIYWTALGVWGILRPFPDASLPSRSTVHRTLQYRGPRNQLLDDDKQPLQGERTYFVALPKPPKEWDDLKQPLNFKIHRDEAIFLRKHLIGVTRPGTTNIPSLLSRLVELRVPMAGVKFPWHPSILRVADSEERKALMRAKQLAALSAIGRGVYAALVEQLSQDDGISQIEDLHRQNLKAVIHKNSKAAEKLDIGAVKSDAPTVPPLILEILEATQQWLRDGKTSLKDLYPLYSQAEMKRKNQRARLASTLAGRQKRIEWEPSKHPKAEPLHYRWPRVQQLLSDLESK